MKKLLFTLSTTFIIAFAIFTAPSVSSAQALPFGGSIEDATFCTCSYTWLVTVGDPSSSNVTDSSGGTVTDSSGNAVTSSFAGTWEWGGTFVYSPLSTILYMWYQIFYSGPNVLGLYTPGAGICLMYEGIECNTYGESDGLMTMVGTSLE